MGQYVDAGVKTWYDAWGSDQPPLLLMHGGLGSNAEWEQSAPAFAEHFSVFAPERRAHGHTPDVEGPLTYAAMAADTIAFLEKVVGAPAHLVGWSDGGILALLVAMERPDLVAKIVPVSANFHTDGIPAETKHMLNSMPADSPAFSFIRSLYAAVSPDGDEHWPVFFEKFIQMANREPALEAKELSVIEAPTLILSGDDDLVSLEHTIEMYRSIPNAQLAIVPGTSHFLLMEKPEYVYGLISDFLLKDPAPTMMPVRRHQPEA